MAAEVAAISLSTRSPNSSCLMSRPLGRSSCEQHHKGWNDPLTSSLYSCGRSVTLTQWQKVGGPRHVTHFCKPWRDVPHRPCLELSAMWTLEPHAPPTLPSLRTHLLPRRPSLLEPTRPFSCSCLNPNPTAAVLTLSVLGISFKNLFKCR